MRIRNSTSKKRRALLCLLLTCAPLSTTALADNSDLTDLSLEALMNLEVTSVSKKEEPAHTAAAAIFVLTNEDIRRSGATSIPEALRLVPGLTVAKIDSSRWAISARGFNGLFANKLLVLIDGRSVYTPLYAGVNWDQQDVMLGDIDRIEVIRGPGASLWGANAVNGVINIITRNAHETLGGRVGIAVGDEVRNITSIRYGAALSDKTAARVFLKYQNLDETDAVGGGENTDSWSMWHGGTRLDWQEGKDSFLFELEGHGAREGLRLMVPTTTAPYSRIQDGNGYASGGHILGRYESSLSESTEFSVQLYYDKVDREDLPLRRIYDTLDIDTQVRSKLSASNEIMFGLNYRYVHDDLRGRTIVSFEPERRETSLLSSFIQDEMEIVPDRFKFIFGTKLEHNDFTGFEVEPTIRGVWTPSRSQTIWGAVSRATRTPSRADNDVFLMSNIRQDPTTGLPLEADVIGNRDLQSEDLLAVEVGYRHQSSKRFSLDLALFFNHYEDLRSYEARSPQLVPFPSPVIHVPLVASDSLRADTFGGEIVSDILVLPELHVQLGYSYVDINLSNEDGVNLAPVTEPDRETPQSQFFFRSMLDLPQGWELDSTLRWVDNIPQFGIDAYTEMSVRLGWKASKNLELSLLVANFFHDDHREYDINVFGGQAAEVERSILGRVVWKF